MKIALMAPERKWSIYLNFEEISERLSDKHDIDIIQSNTLTPKLKEYDKAIIHFQDFEGFNSSLWNEIKDYTWVNCGGFNYTEVPWDRIENVIARSKFMAEKLPIESSICRVGIDPDVFYPTDSQRIHKLGTAMNDWKVRAMTEGIDKYPNLYQHDGWNDEFYDRDQMRNLYNSIETYCSFSKFEGGGNTIIEAAACGCNVVSTNVGFAYSLNGVEIIPYDPDPETLLKAADRAEPFVDEILDDWTWEDVIPEWENALDL